VSANTELNDLHRQIADELETSLSPLGKNEPSWFPSLLRASTVTALLLQNNWQATLGWTERGEIEPQAIKIRVGYKPNPYFRDAQTKDAEKGFNEDTIRRYGFDSTGKEESYRTRMEVGGGVSFKMH
jgi:hypothetical protein